MILLKYNFVFITKQNKKQNGSSRTRKDKKGNDVKTALTQFKKKKKNKTKQTFLIVGYIGEFLYNFIYTI